MIVFNPKGKSALATRTAKSSHRGGRWHVRRSTRTGLFSKGGRVIGQAINPGKIKDMMSETGEVSQLASGFYLNTILQNMTGWNDGWKGAVAGLGGAVAMRFIPTWGKCMSRGAMVQLGVKYSLPYISAFFDKSGNVAPQATPQVSVVTAPQISAPVAAQTVGEVNEAEPMEFE